MKNFQFTIINFQFWFLLFLLLPVSAFAASVFIEAPGSVNAGETFSALIQADTDEVSVNSINLVLSFDKDLLNFSGYKEDGLVKLWVDPPREENGKIYLGGIIPGGVAGVYDPRRADLGEIPVVSLLFTARGMGRASLSITESLLLKNDGLGSELAHTRKGASLTIRENPNPAEEIIADQNPPLPFDIELVESSLFSRTPTLLVFGTSDPDSGVKSYEIKVGGRDWREVKSPAPVSRGIFSRQITVRAYDFSGNFQEASILVPGLLSNKLLLIILILILSGILGYKVLKSKT